MVSPLFTAFALIAAGQAEAPAAPEARETSVPNVRSEGVLEWEADGDRGLYLMGHDGRWYYARTNRPCPRLSSTITLGFDTAGPDFDRNSSIVAEGGWRCQVSSVTQSEGPLRRGRS